MDASWSETALGDLETLALAEQDIARGHTDVFKQNLPVTVRCIIESKNWKHLFNLDTRRVERHENLRLLLMPRRIHIRLTHDDRDLATRIACALRRPFATVDDILFAVTLDAGFDIRCIGRCDVSFCH